MNERRMTRRPDGLRTDDRVSTVRSRMMAAIRSRDTAPELRARSALHAAGFRFRLHVRGLPGSPDIVLPRFGTVVFVHGCFWHRHRCPRSKLPQARRDFWRQKFASNRRRDKRNREQLEALGWNVLTLWECEIDDGLAINRLLSRLGRQRAVMDRARA